MLFLFSLLSYKKKIKSFFVFYGYTLFCDFQGFLFSLILYPYVISSGFFFSFSLFVVWCFFAAFLLFECISFSCSVLTFEDDCSLTLMLFLASCYIKHTEL